MGVRHDEGLALLTAAAAPVLDQVDVEVGRAAEHRHYGVFTDWPGIILGKRTDVDM